MSRVLTFEMKINISEDVGRHDVALALARVGAQLDRMRDQFEEGDSAPVRDPDGNVIGQWEITEA